MSISTRSHHSYPLPSFQLLLQVPLPVKHPSVAGTATRPNKSMGHFRTRVKHMMKTKEGHVQTQRYCSPPGTTFRASGKALKSFQSFSLQSRYICVTISSNLEGSGSPTDSTWNHLSRKTLEGIQGKPESCWNPARLSGKPDFLPSTVLHMRQFRWQGLQKGFPHSWLTSDCHLSSGPTAKKQIILHLLSLRHWEDQLKSWNYCG